MTSQAIPPPTLVAFLVGDSITFVPKPWPKAKFKEAFVDTLMDSGDPWVICECKKPPGTTKDDKRWLTVTTLTMEAMKEYETLKSNAADQQSTRGAKTIGNQDTLVLIGIGKSEDEEKYVAKILNENLKLPGEYQKGFQEKETVSEALLVVQETLSEIMVTPLRLTRNEFKMKIPTILIVLEGGLDTIHHVAKAVEKQLPVLLIRGSGMAADLIGYCLEDEHALKTRAPLLFGICFSKASFASLEEDINIIKNNSRMVSEFNILTESAASLKIKVSESIIRTWAMTQVQDESTPAAMVSTDAKTRGSNPGTSTTSHTAERCNPGEPPATRNVQHPSRSNAVSPICHKVPDLESSLKPSPLAVYMLYQILQTDQTVNADEKFGQDLLLYALQGNLYQITEVLVDKGVTLPWGHAKYLYQKVLDQRKEEHEARTSIAGILELPENDDSFPKSQFDVWKVACDIIPYKIGKTQDCNNGIMTPSDLLLWAVLTDKMEMSEIFWKRSPEPILTALIASAILRKMSRRAHWEKEIDFETSMKRHSGVFCQRAIDVTQSLYDYNLQEAIFSLEAENEVAVWGITESALEFSQANKLFKFVAYHVPQRSFNKIWHGGDFVQFSKSTGQLCENKGCCRKICAPSPCAKFVIHYIFFCLFLFCLSAFVLTNITENTWPIDKKSVYEWCAYLWLIADIFEEYGPPVVSTISQFKKYMKTRQWTRKVWNHMSNFWNAMDALSYAVIIIAIAVRFGCESGEFGISRRIYSVGLFLMYTRFLHVLLIPRKFGPTIIMLKEGLKELLRFVLIMAVLIISVGVFYHANLYPNHYDMFSTFGPLHWNVWKIIYYPYWSLYGEIIDELKGEDSTGSCSFDEHVYVNDPNTVRCPRQDWMVSLMAGFAALILNLLLANLIIAMFSFRFEEIKNNSDQYWRVHRSRVIMEFRERIPVPLNLLLRPCLFVLGRIVPYCGKQCTWTGKKPGKNDRADLHLKQQIIAGRWKMRETDAL